MDRDAGLTLDLDAGPKPEASTADGGATLDGGAPVDAGSDAGLDAGPPDWGLDAGLLDCVAIYGAVGGFELCEERARLCRFYADPSGNQSCDQICGGGRCIFAYDNEPDTCREPPPRRRGQCGVSRDDQVCVCLLRRR